MPCRAIDLEVAWQVKVAPAVPARRSAGSTPLISRPLCVVGPPPCSHQFLVCGLVPAEVLARTQSSVAVGLDETVAFGHIQVGAGVV